ncbi:hypothetical protein [Catenulispora subtropica]|uniref:Uncharacterized protein n=1 Tax=Catenulispora subtropica TaxID=450798 RepID=A0ABP5BWS0_9ACTN
MPCHRCGARQTDPVKGASPWRRGVRAGEQVLVCPDCQRGRDWTADLAHCSECGSARLVRTLGSTQCKDCGAEDSVTAEQPAAAGAGEGAGRESRAGATSLSDDVHAALERHFRHRDD